MFLAYETTAYFHYVYILVVFANPYYETNLPYAYLILIYIYFRNILLGHFCIFHTILLLFFANQSIVLFLCSLLKVYHRDCLTVPLNDLDVLFLMLKNVQ